MFKSLILTLSLIASFLVQAQELKLTELERAKLHEQFLSVSGQIESRNPGGDLIGNGGGDAEQNFYFVYNKMGEILSYCLAKPGCGNLPKRQEVLLQMKDAWNKMQNDADDVSIRFLNKSIYDSFFSGESYASTGLYPSSPIYFNEDLIYKYRFEKDLLGITSIWARVFADQVGLKGESFYRELAYDLAWFYFSPREVTSLKVMNSVLAFWQDGLDRRAHTYRHFFLNVDGEFLPVDFPLLCQDGKVPFAKTLQNVSWGRVSFENKSSVSLELQGEITIDCSLKSERYQFKNRFDFVLDSYGNLTQGKSSSFLLLD